MKTRARLTGLASVAAMVVTIAAVSLSDASAADPPAPGVVQGTMFHDLDNDGVRDDDEPGVPGVGVNGGGRSAITDANGNYSLSVGQRVVKLRVSTGWYRSQCNTLDCPVGPGPDNDWPQTNQIIRVDAVDATAGAQMDLGLLPDWPGGYPIPAAPVPANADDVSIRLSWIVVGPGSNCVRTANLRHHSCAVGDTPTANIQIANEGTNPLSGISGFAVLPPNHRIGSSSRSLLPPTHPNVGDLVFGTPDPVTGRIPFTLGGSLPPAATANFVVSTEILPGAAISAMPLLLSNPYPNELTMVVTSPADPDGCVDPCGRGQHDKQQPNDNTDFHGWQIVASEVAPTVTGFSVPGARPGVRITVNGTGLRSAMGPTTIAFTGVAAPVTVNPTADGTSFTVVVPLTAIQGPITVANPNGSVTTETFVVRRAPSDIGFSPTSGQVGQFITITGNNLKGTNVVSFNGIRATSIRVLTSTSMTVRIPVGATTGKVTVANPWGSAVSVADFTIAGVSGP